MKLNSLHRTTVLASTALVLSAGLAACSGDEGMSGSAAPAKASADPAKSSPSADVAAQTFGPGCASVPTSGAGSFDGMVKDPVATAASNNPLLTTLVAAVGAVEGLGDTLNSQPALTVFAPYDPAFAEIPKADLDALVQGGIEQGQESTLYTILAHHVVGSNADADAVGGEQETLAGDTLTIEGDAESGMTVSDGTVTATVLCGNIPTANATVYVIDKVLTGVK